MKMEMEEDLTALLGGITASVTMKKQSTYMCWKG